MNLIRLGAVPIFFQEDLHLPMHECRCLPYVAALLTAGWRLVKDGSPNHRDVLCGAKHLQDVKNMRMAKLYRHIEWRFVARLMIVEGVKFKPHDFVAQLIADKALFKALQAAPKYLWYLDQLKTQLKHSQKCRQSVLASQPDHAGDYVIIPKQGFDPRHATTFAKMYEREQRIGA